VLRTHQTTSEHHTVSGRYAYKIRQLLSLRFSCTVKNKIKYVTHKGSVRTSQRTQCTLIRGANFFIMCTETTTVSMSSKSRASHCKTWKYIQLGLSFQR